MLCNSLPSFSLDIKSSEDTNVCYSEREGECGMLMTDEEVNGGDLPFGVPYLTTVLDIFVPKGMFV